MTRGPPEPMYAPPLLLTDLAAWAPNAGIPDGFAWLDERAGVLHRFDAVAQRWDKFVPIKALRAPPARSGFYRGPLLWRALIRDAARFAGAVLAAGGAVVMLIATAYVFLPLLGR